MAVKKRELVSPIKERLVILEHDGSRAEVLPVAEVNEDRILAGEYSVPIEDVKQFISPEGRVYVLSAPDWYVNESRHLQAVEMSTVIKQSVAYQRPGTQQHGSGAAGLKWVAWVLVGVVAVIAFILMKG